MRIFEDFFRPVKQDGTVLPYSRFDIFLSIPLAIELMAAVSYSVDPSGGWTRLRLAIFALLTILIWLLAQHRRIVFGCATGIITGRLLIGLLWGKHLALLGIGALILGAITWQLLKDCDSAG